MIPSWSTASFRQGRRFSSRPGELCAEGIPSWRNPLVHVLIENIGRQTALFDQQKGYLVETPQAVMVAFDVEAPVEKLFKVD